MKVDYKVGKDAGRQIDPFRLNLLNAMFLVFMTLKLTGEIDWSWWWVTAPLWIPWAVLAAFLLIIGGLYLVLTLIINYRKRRKRLAREKRIREAQEMNGQP